MTPEQYDELYEAVYAPIYEWDAEDQWYREQAEIAANRRATIEALRILSRAIALGFRRCECRRQ